VESVVAGSEGSSSDYGQWEFTVSLGVKYENMFVKMLGECEWFLTIFLILRISAFFY
jgi:hypothetical protein